MQRTLFRLMIVALFFVLVMQGEALAESHATTYSSVNCNAAEPVESSGLYSSRISTRTLESRYLREARKYRAEGRYELARQSYVLALSITNNEKRLSVIRHELDGLELLLRTMR